MRDESRRAYDKAVEAINSEIDAVWEEMKVLDARLRTLRQSRSALQRLMAKPDDVVNLGLSDAIRKVLEDSHLPCTVLFMRESLEGIGYDFSNYKNPLGSISGTLERLRKSGEAKRVRVARIDGERVAGYLAVRKNKEGE